MPDFRMGGFTSSGISGSQVFSVSWCQRCIQARKSTPCVSDSISGSPCRLRDAAPGRCRPEVAGSPEPGLREAFAWLRAAGRPGFREFMAKLGRAGTAAGRGASTCDCAGWLGGMGAGPGGADSRRRRLRLWCGRWRRGRAAEAAFQSFQRLLVDRGLFGGRRLDHDLGLQTCESHQAANPGRSGPCGS
jgi:hypothetical protein